MNGLVFLLLVGVVCGVYGVIWMWIQLFSKRQEKRDRKEMLAELRRRFL